MLEVERSELLEREVLELERVLLEVELLEAGGQMLLLRRASWMMVRTSAAVTAALADAGVERGGGVGGSWWSTGRIRRSLMGLP